MLTSLTFLFGFLAVICGPGLIAQHLEARRKSAAGDAN